MALYQECRPESLPFVTTETLEPLYGLFGQDRALAAMRFGTRIEHGGYNLFVLGSPAGGFDDAVRALLKQAAEEDPVPSDWIYVTNFDDPNKPHALRLTPGDGRRFQEKVDEAVQDLRSSLPAIFQSEEYLARRRSIEDAFERRHTEALSVIQKSAEADGIALVSTPNGIGVAAMKDGSVMAPEDFAGLPEAERNRFERRIDEIQNQIEEIFRQIPRWEAERVENLRTLNKEFADYAVGHVVRALETDFAGDEAVCLWVRQMGENVVDQVRDFAPESDERSGEDRMADRASTWQEPFQRYAVNLLVDHGETGGAPVITLDHPTLGNLVGRVEYRSFMGSLVTDATMIRPGALHRANGGYLIINALQILQEPLAWEALKRALTRQAVTVESPAEQYGMVNTVMLEPEPIPIDLKVVLYGTPYLFHLLSGREPDFPKLFKVQVEFADWVPRTDDSILHFARFLGTQAKTGGLLPLEPTGVARMVEQATRMAGDAERLSVLADPLTDLLREADFVARDEGAPVISGTHVTEALAARENRADAMRERYLRFIDDEMKIIETDGMRTGQINSLFVHSIPNYRFGSPSRVTARIRPGAGGVMNIERSVGFGRSVYAKGVEILSAWILSKFAKTRPLQFVATITHEQSYGPIDGDSASSTELYVLLSALADVPIAQGLAVTGSVNQFGEVQVIGGVNEKIEGFYDVCAARGLTGEQGVLIPAGNVRSLMLRRDIVEAAQDGRFHIYPVETIEEGLELLTGMDAGEPDEDGLYPAETVYGRAQRRLAKLNPQRGGGGSGGAANGGDNGSGRPRWWPFAR